MLQLAPMGKLRKLLWLNVFSHIALFASPLYRQRGKLRIKSRHYTRARTSTYTAPTAMGVIMAGSHRRVSGAAIKVRTIKNLIAGGNVMFNERKHYAEFYSYNGTGYTCSVPHSYEHHRGTRM